MNGLKFNITAARSSLAFKVVDCSENSAMESMEIRKKLKFKKTRTGIQEYRKSGEVFLMPNGYRLATVRETEDNWDTIRNQGFNGKMRLLDGYICKEPACLGNHVVCLPISSSYVIKNTFAECDWEILVKEKEMDKTAGLWKKKDSACYKLNGIILRTKLYEEIDLLQREKRIALALASIHGDSEVLYWLIKDKDSTLLEDFSSCISKLEKDNLVLPLPSYSKMVESLLMTLSKEDDCQGRSTMVDEAIKCLRLGHPNYCGVLLVELLIEIYSAESIVNHKSSDNKSLLDVAIEDAKKGGNALAPVITITEFFFKCPQSSNFQTLKNTDRYEDVLLQAIERGYCGLVENLLKNKNLCEETPTDICQKVATEAIRRGCLECVNNVLVLLKGEDRNELQQDEHKKTLFHYAAESGNSEVFKLLFETYKNYTMIIKDTRGRNFLHWAALNGHAEICKECICYWKLKVEAKDDLGKNSLHYSAKGNKGHEVVDVLIQSSSKELIRSRDGKGRTPLHLACAKGNLKWV